MLTITKARAGMIEAVNVMSAGNSGLAKVNVPPSSPRESVADENDMFQPTRDVAMERNKSAELPGNDDSTIEIVMTGNERRTVSRDELLFAQRVADRADKRIAAGDWLVEDYDIMTDKRVLKVYDDATFRKIFRQALN